MSRHTLHSEENFWPSVSDMFLALFVIALVLYASASQKAGDGDLYIIDQVVAETEELMKEIGERLPEQRAKYDAAAEEIRTEHNNIRGKENSQYSKLIIALSALPQDKNLFGAFKQNIEPTQELTTVVRGLYQACMDTLPQSEPHSGEQMRTVRQHLITFLDKQKMEIPQLRDQLAESARKNSDLQQDILEREKIIKNLQEKLRLLENGNLDEQIITLTTELKKLKGELKKDTRGLIMGKVESLLSKHNLRDKVEIMKSEGILRIPSSSVTFGKMDNSFTEKSIKKGHEVLQHLTDLLKELAEDKEYGPLIESIVIEGHADPGSKRTTWNTTNEIASSYRALLVWFYMNGTFSNQERLQHITNHKKQSLFSHAGFGDRIPVKRNEEESDDDFKKRCRRIDIRFIATPIQVQD